MIIAAWRGSIHAREVKRKQGSGCFSRQIIFADFEHLAS